MGLLAWEIGSLHLGQTRVNPISSSGGGTEMVWALGVGQQPAGSRTRGSGKCGPALPNQQGTSSHSLGSSEEGGEQCVPPGRGGDGSGLEHRAGSLVHKCSLVPAMRVSCTLP